MSVAAHEPARHIAIGHEQQTRRQLARLGGQARQFDLSLFTTQPDSITVAESQTFHVVGIHEKRVCFFNISLAEFAFIEAGPLAAGASGNEDEGVRHSNNITDATTEQMFSAVQIATLEPAGMRGRFTGGK